MAVSRRDRVPGTRARSGKVDTILGHCLLRAALATGVTDPKKATPWLVMKVTPRASRTAAFIALWATALASMDVDTIGIEAFSEWASESRRTVYRNNADFREIWPGHENPNALALLVVEEMRRRGEKVATPSLAVAL